jgi:hypothetical protein
MNSRGKDLSSLEMLKNKILTINYILCGDRQNLIEKRNQVIERVKTT